MTLREAIANVLVSPLFPGELIGLSIDGTLESATIELLSANTATTVLVRFDPDDGQIELFIKNEELQE